jgi:hypothetical protein
VVAEGRVASRSKAVDMDTLWSLGRGHGNGFGACGSGFAMLCRRSQAAYGAQKSVLFFYGHEELTAWHLTDAPAMNDNAIEPRDRL